MTFAEASQRVRQEQSTRTRDLTHELNYESAHAHAHGTAGRIGKGFCRAEFRAKFALWRGQFLGSFGEVFGSEPKKLQQKLQPKPPIALHSKTCENSGEHFQTPANWKTPRGPRLWRILPLLTGCPPQGWRRERGLQTGGRCLSVYALWLVRKRAVTKLSTEMPTKVEASCVKRSTASPRRLPRRTQVNFSTKRPSFSAQRNINSGHEKSHAGPSASNVINF